ncbi:MAG: ABC transporter permease, partial [Lachnospiraceae bacterium]|nr:ABC transporter permease [Lachnospiraceae bacterium]
MIRFIVKRVLTAIVQIFAVTTIVFFVLQLMPGDPVLLMLSQDGSAVDQEAYDALEEELGLDQPVMTQYTTWLNDLLHGDLGTSYSESRPVTEAIGDRLP